MEVSASLSNMFSYSSTSSPPPPPPPTRDFEFQMLPSISHDRETTTSPADELFYKGKLLPLHLPPRLQMVQKLLQNPNTKQAFEEEHFIAISTTPSTSTSTPLESCNISPSESCRVSCELNPDEYFFEWSTELRGFIRDHPKKSWPKKLKLIKHSSLSQKLKASRAYLKSLFSKSGCSDESCAKAACNVGGVYVSKGNKDLLSKDFLHKYIKVPKKGPTLATVMKSFEKDGIEECVDNSHRRSFSGAVKRHSKTKCPSSSSSSSSSGASSSSSSFSFKSGGFYELQFFKRSSSANSELEGSIEAAIAHCKNSQQPFSSRDALNELGFVQGVKIQENPGVSRI